MRNQPPSHRFAILVLAAGLIAAPPAVGAASPQAKAELGERLGGVSLPEALRILQEGGLRIIFTTEIVRDEMRVEAQPTSSEPRALLDEILAPHGLEISDGPGGTLIVVRSAASLENPTRPEGDPTPESLPTIEEEMVVRPSRVSLLRREPVAPLGMTRDEILALPHLGDDFYRALSLLPGVTSTDVTAQFHIRGGRRDETQILLDGQELFEAYHLKDYDSALSLVDSNTLGSADLTTGGYSAQFGDRMSGVLDMTTVTPTGPARGRAAVSVFSASLGGAGTFAEGRGEWLGEARRGTIDFVSRLLGDEDPTYWDVHGKLRYRLDERNRLGLNLLASGDDLTFSEVDGEESSKRIVTDYGSRYAWLSHQIFLGDAAFAESYGSYVEIDRDRFGVEEDEDAAFTVRDLRDTRMLGLRQSWNVEASVRHYLKGGFEIRRWDSSYDYLADKELEVPIAGEESVRVVFNEAFDERHDALYLTDRVRLSDALTLEAGLRWDNYTQTDDSLVSPRLNLAYSVGQRSVLRLAWGHFNQSQRTYELQVEDGETLFHPVEESEHFLLGFERTLVSGQNTGLALRVEAYHREIDNPRPRYENLYEPINTFPEAEPDRIRIAPDQSEAEGVEIFLRGRHGGRFSWFTNYSFATIEDEIDGVHVSRKYEQRHTFNVDLDYRFARNWRLNLAWRYHSGWPTTPLTLEPEIDEEGEVEFLPTLGQLNSRRLPDYHRLDLRASRTWRLGGDIELGFFVDIQNVYDRDNVAGFDAEIDTEEGALDFETEFWSGVLPSIGITLEF